MHGLAGTLIAPTESMAKTNRIGSTLPAATLAQRLASMSTAELMFAARELAKRPATDAAADKACTAVLDHLEKRAPGPSFDAFVAEIYS